jgi:hypothetical protein
VSRAWQVWAAENLLRGVARAEIEARLRSEGVNDEAASALLDEVARSPIFEAAAPLAAEARRRALHTRLMRRLERTAADPTAVARRSGVSAAELRDLYYAGNTPVVLTDWVPAWPAARWTPSSLRERFGAVEVPVTMDRHADPDYDMRSDAHTRSLPLARFIDLIETAEQPTNDFYMVANNRVLERTALGSLLDEAGLPAPLFDVARAKGASALWLGPAGTVTPLHHDTSNILFCQLHGRKRYRLIAPHEPIPLEGARQMYAGLTAEEAAARGALVKEVVLAPGEALFIPVGHWHEVLALDVSISLAFNNFSIDNDFDWYRPGALGP